MTAFDIPSLFHITSFKAGLLCIVVSCLVWFSFGYQKPELFTAIDARIVDSMFRVRGSEATTGQVVVVDIDEKSLQEHGQWPWPRDLVAELTARIYGAGARVVGFDILFAEEDRTSPTLLLDRHRELLAGCADPEMIRAAIEANPRLDHDRLLGETIAGGPAILGYSFLMQPDGFKDEATPMPDLTISLAEEGRGFSSLQLLAAYRSINNLPIIATGASEGFFNVFPDASGTVRKVPLFILMDDIPYPSLAFEVVRVGKGLTEAKLYPAGEAGSEHPQTLLGVALGEAFYHTDAQGQLTINFRGPYATFPYLSAADLLRGSGEERLRDKYVLVGSSAAGIMDMVATPFAERLPGVEVHANAIDNLLQNDPLVWENFTEIGLTYSILVVAGLLMLFALAQLGPLTGFFLALLIILAIVAGNYQFLFLRGQLLGISYIIVSLLTLLTTVTFCNYLFEGKRKSFIRRVFSRYVPPSVVNQLLKTPERLHLSAETREVTVLFCDIRGFTSLAETTQPARLSNFLNQYFSLLTEIIVRNQGMVDKYIGDAVMAVWGTPVDDPAHAANAVRAALEITAAIDHQGSGGLELAGTPISVGIGINTGMVSAGNFGSNDRFAYTVLGDNVNLASRLEGLTKFYRVKILAAESTMTAAGDSCWRSIDTVRVKGKNLPVHLYEPLVGPCSPLPAPLARHEQAIDAYRRRQFAEAEELFATLYRRHGEGVHQLYLERCRAYLKTPPAADWQGVHDHN